MLGMFLRVVKVIDIVRSTECSLREEEDDHNPQSADKRTTDPVDNPPGVVDRHQARDDDAKGDTRAQGGVVDSSGWKTISSAACTSIIIIHLRHAIAALVEIEDIGNGDWSQTLSCPCTHTQDGASGQLTGISLG